jgi:hypothetical protein
MYKVYNTNDVLCGEIYESFDEAINKFNRLLEDAYKYNAPFNRANSYSITNNIKTVTMKASEYEAYDTFDGIERLIEVIKEKLGE